MHSYKKLKSQLLGFRKKNRCLEKIETPGPHLFYLNLRRFVKPLKRNCEWLCGCKCTKRSWSEDGAVPGAQKNKEVFGRQRLARERKSENDRHFLFFALEAKKEITSRGKTGSFFLFLIFLSSLVHQQIYKFCLQKA